MKSYPKVSCLMLNWNGIFFTKKAIQSLLKTDYPKLEIIVLDNGSANDEAGRLESLFKRKIRIIKSKKNLGYAEGMNKAFSYATGKYIMLLNNDMYFKSNWLKPLVEKLQANRSVGGCQPKVKDLKSKNHFEYAAAGGGFIDIFGYPFARGRIFSHVEEDRGQYDDEVYISWAGVFLVKREVLEKTGLFDPIYFTYAEDVDLCWRIYGQGYKMMYVPSSVIYHYGGGVLGKNLPRKMFYIHRNHLILLLKYWDIALLLTLFPVRISMDVISFFYYIFSGFPNFSFSIIKAYLSLFTILPIILSSRKKNKKLIKEKFKNSRPVYGGSIVFDYFIRNKRVFNELELQKQAYIIATS